MILNIGSLVSPMTDRTKAILSACYSLPQKILPAAAGPCTLPRVQWIERSGPFLHASTLGERGEVLGLEIALGPTQAFVSCPGSTVVRLFTGTPERLDGELASRRQKPRAIFISPSMD